jgi:hypothetical protein
MPPPTPVVFMPPPCGVFHRSAAELSSDRTVVSRSLVANSLRTLRPQSAACSAPWPAQMMRRSGQLSSSQSGVQSDSRLLLPWPGGIITITRPLP